MEETSIRTKNKGKGILIAGEEILQKKENSMEKLTFLVEENKYQGFR